MKHIYTTHDLIYYQKGKCFGEGDFSGKESVLSESDRRAYLAAYDRMAKSAFDHQKCAPRLAAEEGAVDATLRELYQPPIADASHIPILQMHAYGERRSGTYRNLRLYTSRVWVEKDALHFVDADIPPMGGAEFFLKREKKLRQISFSFFVPETFAAPITPHPLVTTTTGRVMELRQGITDYTKFQVFPNGELHLKDPNLTFHHPTHTCLGTNMLGQEHSITVTIGEGEYSVALDGKDAGTYKAKAELAPDTLFISSGMQPHGEWWLRPLCAVYEGEEECKDFFVCDSSTVEERKDMGTVTLPFALGTKQHKGEHLVLESELPISNPAKNTYLSFETIDPCGTIFINGQRVAYQSSFLSGLVEITPYLKAGSNTLKIEVEPRAPEVFYSWHRHTDPCIASFFGKCSVVFADRVYAKHLHITTIKAGDGMADFRVDLNLSTQWQGSVAFYLTRIFPTQAEEQLLSVEPLNGGDVLSVSYKRAVELWTTESPTLYAIRAEVRDTTGTPVYTHREETGFRTICQKNGKIYLNGRRILMNGALVMQFLPPYDEVPVNHICPTDRQIVMQYLYAKNMGCNTLRLHMLGYGTNDARFAYYADRMGLLLLWTTRLIDIGETGIWQERFTYRDAYRAQMSDVYNHPSIAMWEASNEFHASLDEIDRLYDDFVTTVRGVDESRLISPCSHLYYGGGLYDEMPCSYYQDNGLMDQDMYPAESSYGWRDPLVVRSSHTYCLLLGYGDEYSKLRTQSWKSQPALLKSREHAYLITEFAVIGKQCPTTREAKEVYYNPNSYELGNEPAALGFSLGAEEWHLSQAHQAMCAFQAVKRMRREDVDGMMWCCLMSGANNGAYLKPPIDFQGYRKTAFYALQEAYAPVFAAMATTATHHGKGEIPLELYTDECGHSATVSVSVLDEKDVAVQTLRYENICCNRPVIPLGHLDLDTCEKGFYRVICEVSIDETV